MAKLKKQFVRVLTSLANGKKSYVPGWWYVDGNGLAVKKAEPDGPETIADPEGVEAKKEAPSPKKKGPRKKKAEPEQEVQPSNEE